VGESVVSRYLWHFWITHLDRVVLSHPDQDHAGGVPAILKNFDVAEFAYGEIRTDPALGRILQTAHKKLIPARLTGRGDTIVQGGVRISLLNPPAGGVNQTTNDNSIVLHLEFGRFSALLTGDLEAPGETDVLSHCRKLDGVMLKVSHHGSRHGTMESFLSRVNPKWAVISVGRNNPFGHPAPEVMSRLLRHGVLPLATTDHGAVSVETDGIRYQIESHVCGIVEKGLLPAKMR
jgi:competence protein ComEC